MKTKTEIFIENNIVANLFSHKILKAARMFVVALAFVIKCCFLWAFGILWNIVSGIINGVFQIAIGFIVIVLSFIGFFAFILWLFTL